MPRIRYTVLQRAECHCITKTRLFYSVPVFNVFPTDRIPADGNAYESWI